VVRRVMGGGGRSGDGLGFVELQIEEVSVAQDM
jgi:hypothetical protein